MQWVMRIDLSIAEILSLYHLSEFSSLSSHEECCCIARVFCSSGKASINRWPQVCSIQDINQTISPQSDTKVLILSLVWAVRLSQNKTHLDSVYGFLNPNYWKFNACPSILLKIYINIMPCLALVLCNSLSLSSKNNSNMWLFFIWSKADLRGALVFV